MQLSDGRDRPVSRLRRHLGRRSTALDSAAADALRTVASLNSSQAVIRFTPSGEIIEANDNFLQALGYQGHEIAGRHHRLFVFAGEADSEEYRRFWAALARGEFQSARFRRVGKGGREVWIQATYNPIFDDDGEVVEVVKYAIDITRQQQAQKEIQDRSQAIVEFEPDGTIITANERFLSAVGYSLSEVVGQHHRLFMPPGQADDPQYADLWPSLAAGKYLEGEFQRVDKHGRELWLRGAYNPVTGLSGEVVRVVKSVSDVTAQVLAKREADDVGRSIAGTVGELTEAIREISDTIGRTANLADEAERGAVEASAKVAKLDAASGTIGQVIDLIQDLSEQTNLLALNATIEAARAGEAGQGFAVVANEVKLLATQTGQAAGEIGDSAKAIQSEIASVVDVIGTISESVSEVSAMTRTVADAVEEQSTLTHRMSESADHLVTINHTPPG